MLVFREASLKDVTKLQLLEQAVVEAERPFNSSIKYEGAYYYDIPDLISSPDSHLLVAENNNDIVATGYVQIRQSKPSLKHETHGYLGFMYVIPEFRGRGINKIILDKLINWAKVKGITDFYLDVYSENQSAIRAYQKAGFSSSMLEMKMSTE